MTKHILATALLLAACDNDPRDAVVKNTAADHGATGPRTVGWRSNNEDLRNLSEQPDDRRSR